MTIYGMYREVPKQYYMKDGTYKELLNSFKMNWTVLEKQLKWE